MRRFVVRSFHEFANAVPTVLYFFASVISVVTLMVAKHDYDARRYQEAVAADVTVVPLIQNQH